MDTLCLASVHSFLKYKVSTPAYGSCVYSRSMMRICIFILSLCKILVATHAALLAPELYWKSMLPTAPIPKPIAVLLHPAAAGKKSGNGSTVQVEVHLASVTFNYGNYYKVHSEAKLQDNPDTALFFLEKDLKSDSKMNFLFTPFSKRASFLPREVVKDIPFSSSKMAQILNKFSVKPGSINAEVIKNTIKDCEAPGIKREEKYCATSLESMVDFTILKLGENVEAFCTEVINKNETKKQEYKIIMNGVEKVGETKMVVCHKLNYVYAVFYCHKIENTIAYTVSLEGVDGSKVKAVSVCHRDTSQWNPNHLAFQMLKVKPGTVPICHFLFQDSIAWVVKQN